MSIVRIELTSDSGRYLIETDGQETIDLTGPDGTKNTIGGDGARRIGASIRQFLFACATEDAIARMRKRSGL